MADRPAATAGPLDALDPRRFREVLGHYPTGVALVTAVSPGGEPVGLIVGSFTSVSLDPPLVAYLPGRYSRRHARIAEAPSFAVNVLSADQEEICRRFTEDPDTAWDAVTWQPGPQGSPILDGVVAWLECRPEATHDGGDHLIVLGRVTSLAVTNPVAPLLFFQGGYGRFASRSLVARTGSSDLISSVRLAEVARPHLERLAVQVNASVSALAHVGNDLVVVASAAGSGVASSAGLGDRTPLIAPLGMIHVAYDGEEALARWLERAGSLHPAVRQRYLDQLQEVRRLGWTLALRALREDQQVVAAVRDYAASDLTPAAERRLRETLPRLVDLYQPVELSPGQRYDVSTIVAPVLGPDHRPLLVLRLGDLPSHRSGIAVTDWIDRLRRTSQDVARALVDATLA